MQETVSDLAGDSMMLSASESPTDNPFRLDAIICIHKLIKGRYTTQEKRLITQPVLYLTRNLKNTNELLCYLDYRVVKG
jgi:hypothetical protein